jgi:hypothetical protein
MANSTADLLLSVRLMLIEDSLVSSLVEDRVRTAHVAQAGGAAPLMPLVIVAPIGGAMPYGGGFSATSLEVYCYSKTSEGEALAVYEAVHRRLQAARIAVESVSLRGLLREAGRPRHGYNDALLAYYTRSLWTALTAG